MLFYKQESADCKALEQSQDGYFSFINTPYTVCQIIRQVFYEFVIKSCLPMILNVTLAQGQIYLGQVHGPGPPGISPGPEMPGGPFESKKKSGKLILLT